MFSTLVNHFQLLKQLMRGKHLKLVAAEESIHTLHSSLNVQLLFYIIKSRPISKTSHHVFGMCNCALDLCVCSTRLNHLMYLHPSH